MADSTAKGGNEQHKDLIAEQGDDALAIRLTGSGWCS